MFDYQRVKLQTNKGDEEHPWISNWMVLATPKVNVAETKQPSNAETTS